MCVPFQGKALDLQFTLGDALVFAAQGPSSPAGRDLWTQTQDQWRVSTCTIETGHINTGWL